MAPVPVASRSITLQNATVEKRGTTWASTATRPGRAGGRTLGEAEPEHEQPGEAPDPDGAEISHAPRRCRRVRRLLASSIGVCGLADRGLPAGNLAVAPPRRPRPAAADNDIFGLTKVWAIHLNLTAPEYEALQPEPAASASPVGLRRAEGETQGQARPRTQSLRHRIRLGPRGSDRWRQNILQGRPAIRRQRHLFRLRRRCQATLSHRLRPARQATLPRPDHDQSPPRQHGCLAWRLIVVRPWKSCLPCRSKSMRKGGTSAAEAK